MNAMLVWAFIAASATYPTATSTPITAATTTAPQSLEQKIEAGALLHGVDPTLVKSIIFCESSNRAHATGTAAVVGTDHGYWQINSYFHEADAKKIGLDIYDPDDNLEYGFQLLAKQGTQPWAASRACWEKKLSTYEGMVNVSQPLYYEDVKADVLARA